MEKESDKLDKSFQTYLKQQKHQKIQLSEDITNIWNDYSFGKTLLESRNSMTPLKSRHSHQTPKTDLKMTNALLAAEINAISQSEPGDRFENPFKQFAVEKLLMMQRPTTVTVKKSNIAAIKATEDQNQLNRVHVEPALQTISSESSYGQLPSPKRNDLNISSKIQIEEKLMAAAKSSKETPLLAPLTDVMSQPKMENNTNDKEIAKIASDDDKKNESTNGKVSIASPTVSSPTSISSAPSPIHLESPKVDVEMEPAVEVDNLPLKRFTAVENESETDYDLEESLEISIGPKQDISSSEDVWI